MLREKFPSDAQEDLRAELRGAYKAGGRNAVGVFLAGCVTPLKRRQVLAGIDHAEKLALEYRPSMRTVGKRAKRFALRNGDVPKFTARDIAHMKDTGRGLHAQGKDFAYEMTVGQRPMDEFKIDLVASGRPVPKRRAAKNGRVASKPRKATKKAAAPEKIPSVWAEKGRERAVSDWQHGARGTIHTADLPSSLRSTEAWMLKGLTAAERSKAVRGMAAGYAEAWRYMGGKVVGKMVARKGR